MPRVTRRIMSEIHHNAKQYLLTHCESYYTTSTNSDDDAVLGWKPISIPPELEFLMESFEAVEPIRIPGLKARPNAMAYRTRFDELYGHYKKYGTQRHGTYLWEKDFKILLWRSFPNLKHEVERFEYPLKDRDGVNILDEKTGHLKMIYAHHDIIVGIKFFPDGLPAV